MRSPSAGTVEEPHSARFRRAIGTWRNFDCSDAWIMRSPSAGTVEEPHSARFRRVRSGRNPDGDRQVGGLRMSQPSSGDDFTHRPVMVDEIVDLLGPVPAGIIVDATIGGGGHSRALLLAHPQLSIIGLDRDPIAVEAGRTSLESFGPRAIVRHARFDDLQRELEAAGAHAISGALFDLGVSSPQLDRPERGFSYRESGPLDMRMNPDDRLTAADIVNRAPELELARLFRENGEGKFGGRIARAIVQARPIETTVELADIVRAAIPAATRRTGGHPAKRVFQGIRIAVNGELDALRPALDAAINALVPGGRIVVLSYHSGEDKIVKGTFRDAETGGCVCPPGLPCVCGAIPTLKLLNRSARRPAAAEVAENPRAESARLRAAEKLATDPATPADALKGTDA